jgi:hypothetical protein
VCLGDFNEVLYQHEHVRVQERSLTQIAGFCEAIDVCGLHDLGYISPNWAYEKKVVGGSYCRVRLDQALASPEWCERFLLASVRHLMSIHSDHCPILLSLEEQTRQPRQRKE